jgi:Flp pilus assembly protein TadB
MTVEDAVFIFAAGIILLVLFIWYMHRRASRRLDRIQNELVDQT